MEVKINRRKKFHMIQPPQKWKFKSYCMYWGLGLWWGFVWNHTSVTVSYVLVLFCLVWNWCLRKIRGYLYNNSAGSFIVHLLIFLGQVVVRKYDDWLQSFDKNTKTPDHYEVFFINFKLVQNKEKWRKRYKISYIKMFSVYLLMS